MTVPLRLHVALLYLLGDAVTGWRGVCASLRPALLLSYLCVWVTAQVPCVCRTVADLGDG